MVSVRKAHQVNVIDAEYWISNLAVSESKRQALARIWSKVSHILLNKGQCQQKSYEMVEILAPLNLDSDALCAAFLVPLIQDQLIEADFLAQHVKSSVVKLCQGISQMEAIKTLQKSTHRKETRKEYSAQQIENIRKMLLAMADDVRVVVIKLAERLCNLRFVKNSDEETRVLAAKECENIYAPLANRLGIGQIKWELEDIAFRYLHPKVYIDIASLLAEKRLDREQYMEEFVSFLSQQLEVAQITGVVNGRPKHIYSIWKKMQKKSLDFEEVYDVRAVRVIVDELKDCYGVLGIIHTHWQHLPKEFDDYIASPKANGYQSIHTVVLGSQNKAIEVQIRTQAMHEHAEMGVAAHWRYKEGSNNGKVLDKKSRIDEKISWLRKILQWQEDVNENADLIEELRSQVFEDRIYVFTPTNEVIDLPLGSTPLDFAYYIHSNIGHRCIGAKVFGKIVPFTYPLKTGDKIEILTAKQPNPSRDWLNPNLHYIHTSRARSKVQHFFKLQDRDKNIAHGKQLLDVEIQKLSLSHIPLSSIIERFNVKTVDDLYAALGSGHARLQQVVNYLLLLDEKLNPPPEIDPQSLVKAPVQQKKFAVDKNGITVSGVGNLLTHFAKCCHPVAGDSILGFITQGRGISVHREDCEQLSLALKEQPEREVEVQWGGASQQAYQVSIQIIANDRQGLIRDISAIITNERVNIIGISSYIEAKSNSLIMVVKVEINNRELLSKLIDKLIRLTDVSTVKRL